MLIALAITAALLVATAVAVDAAIDAYAVTQSENNTMTRARVALHRITTYARTSDGHAPYTPAKETQFVLGQTIDDVGLRVLVDDGDEIAIYYDPATGKLMADTDANSYVLLNGVLDFRVRMEPMRSAESIKTGGGHDRLRRATVTLKLIETQQNVGTARPLTLSTAVVPRKNL